MVASLGSAPWALVLASFILAWAPLEAAAATPAPAAAAADISARLPDGRRIHFHCLGRGSPTVLFESGFGADAGAWYGVQPRVAAVTRACAYDRAGAGGSDPGPLPRTGAAIARDLDQALTAAGIRGPFVVVGHSAGGLYGRLFAARRHRQVVGLVFVDPSVEHQIRRAVALGGDPDALNGIRRRPAQCLKATRAPADPANAAALADCAPRTLDPVALRRALRPETWATQLSELDTLFEVTSDQAQRTTRVLRDVPAIVLTAGSEDRAANPGDPPTSFWQALHAELAAKFAVSQQRIVKSSHLMMVDRPEVVAASTLELVKQARRR